MVLRRIFDTWQKILDHHFHEASCDPCLLLVSATSRDIENICSLSLVRVNFSGSSAEPEPVDLGCFPGRICGTGYGWLMVIGRPTALEFSISLANPISKRRLYLPSSSTFIRAFNHDELLSAYNSVAATISLLENSISPASGCVIIMSCHPHHSLSFYKYMRNGNNQNWTSVESSCLDCYTSFVYHKGNIVALHQSGGVDLIKIDSLVKIQVAPHYSFKNLYDICWAPPTPRIVSTSAGIYLVVPIDDEVYMYELDPTIESPWWKLTSDVGNLVLFYDRYNLLCSVVERGDRRDLKINYVHCLDADSHHHFAFHLPSYSLEKRTLKYSQLGFENYRWYLPGL